MIYFTSDPHYFHEAVIKFCQRPFKDAHSMNEELIKRYNAKVKENDVCIIVGDFSFGSGEQTKAILRRLNGTKILVKGNHDKQNSANKFDLTVESMTIRIAGHLVTVKHYPLKWKRFSHLMERLRRYFKKTKNPKFLDNMPENSGQLHIHGHTHRKERFVENQIHVGVDAWDYAPVSIVELGSYIQSYKSKGTKKA